MPKKILPDINMGDTWNAYISSAEAVLRGAGLWDEPTCMLMGMTGMAFHFIVEKNMDASSITVYDFVGEHYEMMDRIGVHTDNYFLGNDTLNTILYQRNISVKRIKESINKGLAVINWAPTNILEFGVIHGYDDNDGVFFVKDVTRKDADPLQYENLGKSAVPFFYYQIISGRTEMEKLKTIRQSLVYSAGQWEKQFHINRNYSSGRKGYENMINYLAREKSAGYGLGYILASYADSKSCIADYLKYIVDENYPLKDIHKAADNFEKIKNYYSNLTGLFPFVSQYLPEAKEAYRKSSKNIPEMLKIVKECLKLEEDAMGIIKKALE